MWPFSRKDTNQKSSAPIFFTNTLSGKKEPFAPLHAGLVSMYSCGPTVYSQAHIGNLRAYVFSDLIARVLAQAGYRVRRVINITDVGHLVSDADEGEDKMEKSSREAGVSASQLAERYTRLFLKDIHTLNLAIDDILFPRATEYIKEQIAFIQELERKGHTYGISDGVYFDTSTFPGYGNLGGIPQELIKDGSVASLSDRVAYAGQSRIGENAEKRNPADFALWKFSPADVVRQQEWDSPWGHGFPGWHLECSTMAKALLGETLDLHTGGIDHIPVHHTNEIAQSESVSGKPLARYWMHSAFLNLGGERFAKSENRVVYLSDIEARGIHPLALRYFFLQAHYRSPLSFSWEALSAANEALERLWRHAREIREESGGSISPSEPRDHVIALMRDDLGIPQALALLWEAVRNEELTPKQAWGVICAADEVLGLSLTNPPIPVLEVPDGIQDLKEARDAARENQDFKKADEIRKQIEERGYRVDDMPQGSAIRKL